MNIQIFKNPEFGQIRTITGNNGEPWFVGKDVADVLEYTNPLKAIRDHVDDDDKRGERIVHPSGGPQQTIIINESGLYSLIIASKLPQARAFKRWVTNEVLPEIRKTGGYITVSHEDDEKTILTKAVGIYMKTVERLKTQLSDQQPMVDFAKAVCESDDTITVAELAKELYDNGINIGQNRLFEWLRNHHYLGSTEHHRNIPMQKYIENGLFKVKNSEPWYDNNGCSHYSVTTLVTGKGVKYFVNLFLNNGNVSFS